MRERPALSAVILLFGKICVLQAQVPPIQPHPPIEHEVASARDAAWDSTDDRCRVSFATTDIAFARHEVPKLREEASSWSGLAWRGERIHAQILVWSKRPVTQLRVETTALVSSEGETIPAAALRARFVRYVLSELPLGSRRTDCGEINREAAYLVPDVLDPAERFDVAGSTTRPVWLTIDVPRTTVPGTYRGRINVRAAGGISVPLSLSLEVEGGTVPLPATWTFRVDLWQNPWAVARQHRVVPWSPAHLSILREHLKMLADMGQTYVSVYITDSPWQDDTYVADSTMVEWIREPDGTFHFDYRILDAYVELAMASGIDDAISAFTMVPWKGRVGYIDASTGERRWENWSADSEEYKRFWRSFLADLRAHLTRKGWFDKTYLEVNERSLEDTLRAIELARSDAPAWKFTYAGRHHPELLRPVDDLCTVLGHESPSADIRERRGRGQTSTFYVCCEPAFPNDFPFSPPAENVWMGWHAAAMGMDGFLRWAWDSWPAEPLLDSRHIRFPAGDTFLVYPGPLASVRMERLREGIVDYEKFRLVRERLTAAGSPAAKDALSRLERALMLFSWERANGTGGALVADDLRAARAALSAATRVAFPAKPR